jgi:hypothetical protein
MFQAAEMAEASTGRTALVLPPAMDEEGHYFDFISFYRWATSD